MVLLIWIALSIAVGVLASNRGRSGFSWFLVSAFLSPLIGFIFVLVAKDLSTPAANPTATTQTPSAATHVRCPACAEWVLPEASVCKHCGGALTPNRDFHVERARQKASEEKDDSHNLAIGAAALFGLFILAGAISKCAG